ncbi:MAG: hypothetical protein Q8P18_04470 [Pseudomonadota bacterium]|nr:hypothetical protein [Pseudomonadota bacterium]
MLLRQVTVLALLLLTACSEVEIEPRPPAGAVLTAGAYDLVVRDVVAMSCDVDPGVMRGQVLPAELSLGREGVTFSFGGWVLRGAMEPGNLHVEGDIAASEPEPVPVYEEDGDDSDGSEEEVVDEDDGREPEEEGRPESDPRPESRGSALLDATIRAADLAEGSLFVSMPGCEIELSVVIGRGGRSDRPPGDEPSEPGEGEPSEPGDDEPTEPDEGDDRDGREI